MGVIADNHVDGQRVAAGNPAGRMHDHGVTNPRAFRMERFLDDERALMAPGGEDSARILSRKAQRQLGMPASGGSVQGIHEKESAVDAANLARGGQARQLSASGARGVPGAPGARHTATMCRTPSASMSLPSPLATMAPRLITR